MAALASSTADGATFSIVLHSSSDVTASFLRLPAFPETVADLQRDVETQFCVPRCCQTLVFEGVPLRGGDDTLRAHRVRNGDTFHVHYRSEADVKEIRGVVDSMQEALNTIEESYNHHPHYYTPGHEFDRENVLGAITQFEQHIKPEMVECLATHYFQPFTSERAIANRLYFLDIGGLEMLHKLYCIVLKYPWEVTVVTLQYLEQAILRVLWNITASFDIRLHVLRYPFIELCVQSALRVPIQYKGRVLAPEHLALSGNRTILTEHLQERIVGENMHKAFGVLFNLAELPQCQVKIASAPSLLKQAVLIALSPTYKYIASLVTVAGLVCLAYNEDTHHYLAKEDILRQVMEVVYMIKPLHSITPEEAHENRRLLRYFASLLVAQVLTSSLQSVAKETLPRLCRMLQEFLVTADPQALHKHEQNNGYVWSTIRPHLNLAYFPINKRPLAHCSTEMVIETFGSVEDDSVVVETVGVETGAVSYAYYFEDSLLEPVTDDCSFTVVHTINLRKLFLQCVEVGIISLQNMMCGEETRRVLQDEKMGDFVVCLPWFLPSGSKPQQRACELVRSLANFVKLEPPSLANIARAKLATDTFGLEHMLSVYSLHDLIHS